MARWLSNPEMVLVWLFVLFVLCMLLFRSIRRGAEQQQSEEAKRLEELQSQWRRDERRFPGGTSSEAEGTEASPLGSAGPASDIGTS
jgi:hypothetical protein